MVSPDGGRAIFGPSARTQELSGILLKWKSDFKGESIKCATFKIQAVEAANLKVFFGMVKGDAEFKTFRSVLKYSNLFVAQNISGNVIAFMRDRPLEGSPWIFNKPQYKPWSWPEI